MLSFLHGSVIYYTLQLGRCVLLSYGVFALVCLLRKTVCRDRVFLKGALWCLLLPVLLAGRMKFFYESEVGWKLFSWWTAVCISWQWIGWLYLSGVLVCAFLLFRRRYGEKEGGRHGCLCHRYTRHAVYVRDISAQDYHAAGHIGRIRQGRSGNDSAS